MNFNVYSHAPMDLGCWVASPSKHRARWACLCFATGLVDSPQKAYAAVVVQCLGMIFFPAVIAVQSTLSAGDE